MVDRYRGLPNTSPQGLQNLKDTIEAAPGLIEMINAAVEKGSLELIAPAPDHPKGLGVDGDYLPQSRTAYVSSRQLDSNPDGSFDGARAAWTLGRALHRIPMATNNGVRFTSFLAGDGLVGHQQSVVSWLPPWP